jgi:hypothetical protein
MNRDESKRPRGEAHPLPYASACVPANGVVVLVVLAGCSGAPDDSAHSQYDVAPNETQYRTKHMKLALKSSANSPSHSMSRSLMPASGLVVLAVLAGCSSGAPDDSAQPGATLNESALATSCPEGSEPSSEIGGACAAIEPATEPVTVDPSLHNLADVRAGRSSSAASAPGAVTCTGFGNQAGTMYDLSALPMGSATDLQTRMIVNPGGIDNSTHCEIFTTATNRTQLGVEVVGVYAGAGTTPTLAIFDWSCSAGSPCGKDKSPSWVLSRKFDACHAQAQSDGHGHTVDVLYYSNSTRKIAAGNPPEWRNTVLLWNYCSDPKYQFGHWDQIYEHTYRAVMGDGGGWGPVVEPHIQGPLPKIKEVGFLSASLLHNGKWSALTPSVTTFTTPAQAGMTNWRLMFLDPNYAWGIDGK